MNLVCLLLQLFIYAIFVTIIFSWIPVDPDGVAATIRGFFFTITEPVLGPIRRALPPLRLGGMALDLSPIVVVIGISILQGVIC
ncbi:YggT family protein [soil metagenome]